MTITPVGTLHLRHLISQRLRTAFDRTFGRVAPRLILLFQLAATLAACAGTAPADTGTTGGNVVARGDGFVIAQTRRDDTYEALSNEFFGNSDRAETISDANGAISLAAPRLVAIPLRPLLASAVYPEGYQVVPILAYHQFVDGKSTNLMKMAKSSFEQQMDYLRDHDYHVIPLGDFVGFLNGKTSIPKRSVVITIDDGFRSTYDIAYPILKKHGFPATLFVYTDFIGGGAALNWAQIKELSASGIIDVQSHSKTHASLAQSSKEITAQQYASRITTEISTPERLIYEHLGKRVSYYSYPYGDSSVTVTRALEKGDYGAAVTVWRGGNPSFASPLMLKRDMIYGNYSLADFQNALQVYVSVVAP